MLWHIYPRTEKIASGEELQTKVADLIQGSEFFFRVAAFNSQGLGDFLEMDQPLRIKSPHGQ